MNTPPLWMLVLVAVATQVAAAEDPKPRKDAAETVQEGNVKNWVEYYERTRDAQRTPRTTPPADPPAPRPASLEPVTR